MAGCSRVVSPDPSVTDLFSCTQIPSGTNSFVGHDFSRWCDGEAEQLMKRSDRELDPAARLDLMSQIYELQADAAIGLPLFQYPAVTDWREDKIAGPIGAWNGTPYGTFFNMNEWYLAPT